LETVPANRSRFIARFETACNSLSPVNLSSSFNQSFSLKFTLQDIFSPSAINNEFRRTEKTLSFRRSPPPDKDFGHGKSAVFEVIGAPKKFGGPRYIFNEFAVG